MKISSRQLDSLERWLEHDVTADDMQAMLRDRILKKELATSNGTVGWYEAESLPNRRIDRSAFDRSRAMHESLRSLADDRETPRFEGITHRAVRASYADHTIRQLRKAHEAPNAEYRTPHWTSTSKRASIRTHMHRLNGGPVSVRSANPDERLGRYPLEGRACITLHFLTRANIDIERIATDNGLGENPSISSYAKEEEVLIPPGLSCRVVADLTDRRTRARDVFLVQADMEVRASKATFDDWAQRHIPASAPTFTAHVDTNSGRAEPSPGSAPGEGRAAVR